MTLTKQNVEVAKAYLYGSDQRYLGITVAFRSAVDVRKLRKNFEYTFTVRWTDGVSETFKGRLDSEGMAYLHATRVADALGGRI